MGSSPPADRSIAAQENRLKTEIASIEKDTGLKLRFLAQNYPQTPGEPWCTEEQRRRLSEGAVPDLFVAGLAIRDFWKVDDMTVVFVADPSLGNVRP